MVRLVLALCLFVVPALGSAQERDPEFIGRYTDWLLYTADNGRGRVCFIASQPTKEDGNYTRRGPAAVLVAILPVGSDEERVQVSVQPGYGYLADSLVNVEIGRDGFELFTQGEHAWAKTASDDQALIAAMKRGAEMTVRGTSVKETFSLDTYSLRGFTAAYNAMLEACPE